jgi:hypothetical protein
MMPVNAGRCAGRTPVFEAKVEYGLERLPGSGIGMPGPMGHMVAAIAS